MNATRSFTAQAKKLTDMLKEAVVGGPSLVFTRYHEVGKTRIRSHQIAEPQLCQNILGYDANASVSLNNAKRYALRKGKGRSLHRRVPNRWEHLY